MRKIVSLLIVLSFILAPAVGLAASPWTSEETYADKVSGKLQFGVVNTLLGWTDIAAEPNKAMNRGEDSLKALGKGACDSLLNTLGGIIHLATFPIPQIDVPLPENGIDLGS